MATLNVGDIVSICGQVVSVAEDAVTVEIACNDRKHRYNVTLNGGQITDAVTFMESGELPEPDAPWSPFADAIIVEQADTIGIAESTT